MNDKNILTWPHHDRSLYKLNSNGYRCKEFSYIDWNSSFVIMGCSRIFGESLFNDAETVPGHLSLLSNIETVNLGVCGSGIDFILFNSIKMIEINYIPKAVFILWPDPERFLKFKNSEIELYGSWSQTQDLTWIDHDNCLERNNRYSDIIKFLWQTKNVPVIEMTHHPVNKTIVDKIFTDPIDYATDGIHWGPKTCKIVAEKFFHLYLER